MILPDMYVCFCVWKRDRIRSCIRISDRRHHSSNHYCGRVHKEQEKVKQTPAGIILPGSGGSIAEAVLRRAHDTSYCFGEGAPK